MIEDARANLCIGLVDSAVVSRNNTIMYEMGPSTHCSIKSSCRTKGENPKSPLFDAIVIYDQPRRARRWSKSTRACRSASAQPP